MTLSKGRQERLVYLLLGLMVVAFSLYFSFYLFHFHRAQWTGLDQANMEQTLWNTLQGNFLRVTTYPATGREVTDFTDRITESRLADHVQPLQLLLLFPYALFPRSETLLLLVAVAVGLGAVPFFHIAKRRLESPWLALAFAAGYLLLPAIQTNVAWEIHGTHFLPPLMLAALDAAERGKRKWWWLWALLAMSCREDIPFLVGWAFLWLAPVNLKREARIMFAVGLGWSLLNFLVIIPAFSGGGGTPYLVRFFPPGTEMSWGGILAALQEPSYWALQMIHFLEYNLRLALPVLFLYLLDWRAVMAMSPMLLINSLMWDQSARLPFFSHYSSPIIVWTLVGVVNGLLVLRKRMAVRRPQVKWLELGAAAVLISVLANTVMQGYLPVSRTFAWPTGVRAAHITEDILRQVPPEAVVSSGMHLAPRLAQRETLRIFPDLRDAEWIALDLWFWGDPYGGSRETWQDVLADPTWETALAQDGLILLRRGVGPPQGVNEAFQMADERPLPAVEIHFEGEREKLSLQGIQTIPLPLNILALCTDWVAADEGFTVYLSAADDLRQSLFVHMGDDPLPAGTFRTCGRLLLPASDKNVSLWVEDGEGRRLTPVLESEGDWRGHIQVEEAQVSLEIR